MSDAFESRFNAIEQKRNAGLKKVEGRQNEVARHTAVQLSRPPRIASDSIDYIYTTSVGLGSSGCK